MPTISTNNEEVYGAPQDLPGWHRQGNGIQKTFHFDDFACGARFVGRVADAAAAAGRQPALGIRGGPRAGPRPTRRPPPPGRPARPSEPARPAGRHPPTPRGPGRTVEPGGDTEA